MNFIIISARSLKKSKLTIFNASKSQLVGHFNTNTGNSSTKMLENIKEAISSIHSLNRITHIQAVHELNMLDPSSLVVPVPSPYSRHYDAVFVDAAHLGNDLSSLVGFLPGVPKFIMMAQPQSKYKYDYLEGPDYIFAHKALSVRKIKNLILDATSHGKEERFEHGGFEAIFMGGRVIDVSYNGASLKPQHKNANSLIPSKAGLSDNALEMTAYMVQALARKVPIEEVILEYAVRNEDHSLANLATDGASHHINDVAVKNLLAFTKRELNALDNALPSPDSVAAIGGKPKDKKAARKLDGLTL